MPSDRRDQLYQKWRAEKQVSSDAAVYWVIWLLVWFLPAEIYTAAFTPKKKDTFSEFVWWAFGIRRPKGSPPVSWAWLRRSILALFMTSLTLHFVVELSAIWLIVFGIGVGAIFAYALVMERGPMSKRKFSIWISFKKGIRAVLEVTAASVITVLPDFVSNLVGMVDEAHEVVALGLPPVWVGIWLIVVRMFTNWWKNRNLQ